MDKLVIEGGRRLSGTIVVGGSKNAALPLMAATLLAQGKCVIENVPALKDVETLGLILRELGVSVERRADGAIETEVVDEKCSVARYELVSQMRASFCVLGPLLGKRGYAKVSMPGGCVFGLRPIDLHVKGLRALGAEIELEHGYVIARAPKGRLRGGHVYLGGAFGSSVTGTANVMMAAVLAEGKTTIENAACEPEVEDLANFLVAMGATIDGIGTPRLKITGVPELGGAVHTVIPDRIEAGTYALAGAITGGTVRLRKARIDHLAAVVDRLEEIGVHVETRGDELVVTPNGAAEGGFKAVDVTTLPYPGFPTDLQAQLMAILSIAKGISVITEKIYPDRFMHLAELCRMGADIRKEGPTAIIAGAPRLTGADVMASDLRASAALVLAGLVAAGETHVHRVYHIDRGYEHIEEKLNAVGANIKRMKDDVKPGLSC
jgi:UDP-N-acetylglucosamine 1-carboxyvinyltransferase